MNYFDIHRSSKWISNGFSDQLRQKKTHRENVCVHVSVRVCVLGCVDGCECVCIVFVFDLERERKSRRLSSLGLKNAKVFKLGPPFGFEEDSWHGFVGG